MKKLKYKGNYHYCYVTKSSHFHFVMDEVLKTGAFLETSSAFDLDLVKSLHKQGKLKKNHTIICNGFKREEYCKNISEMVADGFTNLTPILDNKNEVELLTEMLSKKIKIGIRIASEEEPKFEFYTSRLGVRYKDIPQFYNNQIKGNDKLELKMLHFFVNTGIRDSAYYWNELHKCLAVYCQMKKLCPTLDSLNIGGGFPVKNSLAFDFDFEYIIEEILSQIQLTCETEGVAVPDIFTEFGSFTVGDSGGVVFKIVGQKQQNDREKWSFIDSSFMTTLPDSWAISKRFLMLPLNRWEDAYERVFLGGLTCDSDDYYNSEQHVNAIYLPKHDANKPLYIGFFNTGAYQDSLSGYGGIHHCLIPQPRHILIDYDYEGNLQYRIFKDRQTAPEMLRILGYESADNTSLS